jgi:hypothetical protein
MQIESISDHLDWVPHIARWHWKEWGDTDPTSSVAQWTQGLYERTLRDKISTTYHKRPISIVRFTFMASALHLQHESAQGVINTPDSINCDYSNASSGGLGVPVPS